MPSTKVSTKANDVEWQSLVRKGDNENITAGVKSEERVSIEQEFQDTGTQNKSLMSILIVSTLLQLIIAMVVGWCSATGYVSDGAGAMADATSFHENFLDNFIAGMCWDKSDNDEQLIKEDELVNLFKHKKKWKSQIKDCNNDGSTRDRKMFLISDAAVLSGLAMRGIQGSSWKRGKGVPIKLSWNEESLSNIQKGFTYRDGAITVNKTGLYFVYSQIRVKLPVEQTTSDIELAYGKPFFTHYLYRHTNGKDREILIEHSKSDCNWISNDNEVSSLFGSVFKLEAGQAVYIETSHPESLIDCGPSNFFGLYSV